jgi:hypothetical protein
MLEKTRAYRPCGKLIDCARHAPTGTTPNSINE